jgi:hypothetical protein
MALLKLERGLLKQSPKQKRNKRTGLPENLEPTVKVNYSRFLYLIDFMEPFVLDLSSNEPHIFNDCPLCGHEFHVKVAATGNCPNCGLAYTMEQVLGGTDISVGWVLTIEQYRAIFGDKKLN